MIVIKKDLKFTFYALAVTVLVPVVVLLGCSGDTATLRVFGTEPVSNTTVVSRDEESTGTVSPESEEFSAEIGAEGTDGQKLEAMASSYPMYGFAIRIGDDKAEVTDTILTDTEPHDWESAATDIKNLEEANLFAYNSAGMEHWADDALVSLGTKRLVSVKALAGFALRPGHSHDEEEHEGAEEHVEGEEHDCDQSDPHIWLSPVSAKKEVENIKNTHVKADPDSKDYYEDNYKTYTVQFDELDQEYRDALSALPDKSIVVSYEALNYLYDTYGPIQMGIVRLSPDTEPDPARMARIIDFVEANHVEIIFFEELISPKVVETIMAGTGTQTRVLNPLEDLGDEKLRNGADCFTVMEDNLKQLKAALE